MNRAEDQKVVNELYRLGMLDRSQLSSIEDLAQTHLNRMGLTKLLISFFHIDESKIAQIIADLFHSPILEDMAGVTAKNIQGLDTLELAEKLKIIPIIQTDREVTIVSNNPPYQKITEYLEKKTGKEITPVVIKTNHFETLYAITASPPGIDRPNFTEFDNLDVEKEGAQAEQVATIPAPQLLERLINLAIHAKASDIHFITTREELLKVQFRIDNVMTRIVTLAKSYTTTIMSILKHNGKLDSFRKGSAQEGFFSIQINKNMINARISCIPTSFGENINLRILTKNLNLMSFDELGMTVDAMMSFKQLLSVPDGVLLFAGPAGAGKTTTMYSALCEFSNSLRTVATVENPVEYLIDSITQIQEKESELDRYMNTVRALFHHDVDVLALGEIRSKEQLNLLIEAGFTGMLACATVQSTSAIQSIYRLANLGVSIQELALVLRGITCQRFIRKNCSHCITEYKPDAETLRMAGLMHIEKEVFFKKGIGCRHCLRTGFIGKMPIFEILLINDEISSLIYHKKSNAEIFHAADIAGYKDMRYDALVKALAGYTSLEEVLRVT